MAVSIFVSRASPGRLSTFAGMTGPWLRWNGVGLRRLADPSVVRRAPDGSGPLSLTVLFLSAVLLYCSAVFYLHAHRKGSVAFQLLALSLALWAVLMGAIQSGNPWMETFGSVGHVLGPVPQMLLGIAMVMVLFENERNAVQENTLALSTLGAIRAALGRRFAAQYAVGAGAIGRRFVRRASRHLRRGALARFAAFGAARILSGILDVLTSSGAGEYICDRALPARGFFTVRDIGQMTEPLPLGPAGTFAGFKDALEKAEIRNLTAVSLQTREHAFGVILFPHAQRKAFGTSGPRLMVGLALQLGSLSRTI